MLSAIVFLSDDRAPGGHYDPLIRVSRSLGGLVGGAVEGLIRDVTIAGPSGLDLEPIADHAGCGIVQDGGDHTRLERALALAKGPNCLVVCAGFVPGQGFIEEIRDHFDCSPPRAGFLRAEPDSLPQRIFPALAPIAAAVAPLTLWRAVQVSGFARTVRALGGRGLRTQMHRVF
jgi:hypothetical protein